MKLSYLFGKTHIRHYDVIMSYTEDSYTTLWRIWSYIENYMTLWCWIIYAAFAKSGKIQMACPNASVYLIQIKIQIYNKTSL